MSHGARERLSHPVHWPQWDSLAVVLVFCSTWQCICLDRRAASFSFVACALHTLQLAAQVSSTARSLGVHYRPRVTNESCTSPIQKVGISTTLSSGGYITFVDHCICTSVPTSIALYWDVRLRQGLFVGLKTPRRLASNAHIVVNCKLWLTLPDTAHDRATTVWMT